MNRKQMPLHLQPHPPTQPAETGVAMSEPEPLWRRVKTIERVVRRLGMLTPDQFDDAGAKIPRYSDEHILCVVREHEVSSGTRALVVLGSGMLAAMLAAYAFLFIRHPWLIAIQTAFIVASVIAVGRSNAKSRARQLGSRAATLLESCRCGACAHPFNQACIGALDLVRCAECGSQWTSARFRNARPQSTFYSAMLTQRPVLQEHVGAQDDRHVRRSYTKPAMKTMMAAARASVPDLRFRTRVLRVKMMHAFKRGWGQSFRWSVPTLVLGIGVVVYVARVTKQTYHEVVSYALAGSAALAVLIFVFSLLTAWSQVRGHRLRLEVGLCPTCRGALDPAATPEFDDCIRCVTCGCLWKRDAIASAVAPDQPTAARPI